MTKVVHCKIEPYDVYIGRPSFAGNPFSHKKGTQAKFLVDSVEEAVKHYDLWVHQQPELIARLKKECTGKILGCWCKRKPKDLCHGDVIVRIYDEE